MLEQFQDNTSKAELRTQVRAHADQHQPLRAQGTHTWSEPHFLQTMPLAAAHSVFQGYAHTDCRLCRRSLAPRTAGVYCSEARQTAHSNTVSQDYGSRTRQASASFAFSRLYSTCLRCTADRALQAYRKLAQAGCDNF